MTDSLTDDIRFVQLYVDFNFRSVRFNSSGSNGSDPFLLRILERLSRAKLCTFYLHLNGAFPLTFRDTDILEALMKLETDFLLVRDNQENHAWIHWNEPRKETAEVVVALHAAMVRDGWRLYNGLCRFRDLPDPDTDSVQRW